MSDSDDDADTRTPISLLLPGGRTLPSASLCSSAGVVLPPLGLLRGCSLRVGAVVRAAPECAVHTVATLTASGEDAAEFSRFVRYLRCGMEGSSAPKGADVVVGGAGGSGSAGAPLHRLLLLPPEHADAPSLELVVAGASPALAAAMRAAAPLRVLGGWGAQRRVAALEPPARAPSPPPGASAVASAPAPPRSPGAGAGAPSAGERLQGAVPAALFGLDAVAYRDGVDAVCALLAREGPGGPCRGYFELPPAEKHLRLLAHDGAEEHGLCRCVRAGRGAARAARRTPRCASCPHRRTPYVATGALS